MAVANCPSCGGPIAFAIGSSVVVVCDYCRTVVARGDRALEDLGKVAALIDTGTPLRRDLPGRYQGTGFRIVGRTQMRHQAGGLWNEWYAAFDDGRWGWLAEAAGKYYVTFKTGAEGLPPANAVEIGGRMGDLVVTEVGTATVVSGEGEIPWRVEPNSTYDYADLSGPKGKFATIDYSEEAPLFFAGREVTLDELGIEPAAEPQRGARIRVEKLSCSNCGGALSLVAPDQAERIVCPNCGGVHDVREGNLRFLSTLKQKGPQPKIPLGAKGTLDGELYVVAGFMERSVHLDQRYAWTEYLLYNQRTGYRWLVESDAHWSFVSPISAGDVSDVEALGAARTVGYDGRTYRLFGDADAKVDFVLGEFYWKVERGETVRAVDYTAPPYGISKEISGKEINYSHARYVKAGELEKAFRVRLVDRPWTVGMMQPFTGGRPGGTWAVLMTLLLVVAIFTSLRNGERQVLTQAIDFASATPDPAATSSDGASAEAGSAATPPATPTHVVFTNPFPLRGERNLEIEASTDVTNSWIDISGDLGNEQSGLLEPFELPIEYYEGYDEGEHWTEGSRSRTVHLAALPAGTYTIRLEAEWDPGRSLPPAVSITVREGVFRWTYFLLAAALISLPAVLMVGRRMSFESSRWQESQFTPLGTLRSDDSSDDDDDE